jgi:hypothetical protein
MLRRFEPSSTQCVWGFLGASAALWCGAAAGPGVQNLPLSAPFVLLGPLFWLGLALAAGAFFLGEGRQRLVAIVVLAWYFIATLSFIYPYPIMHDSIVNTLLFPQQASVQERYSTSYGGFGAVVAWLQHTGALSPWVIARFFPVGMTLLYLLAIGLIGLSWHKRILSSTRSWYLFAFFIFVFANPFYLRINAAPQTIGFIAFLVALGLVPLSARSIPVKVALLLALGAMIVSHPITPLLALPGLIVIALSTSDAPAGRIKRVYELIGLFLVGYIAWTLYRADWLLTNAVQIVFNAAKDEKHIPIVNSPVIHVIDNYLLMNRVFLVALLLVLAAGYFSLWRSRAWYLVTGWGLSFAPAFGLFFSYRDFFDRILLFALVPCALVFAEAGERLCQRRPRLKVLAGALIMALALLSASVTYFWIGAVDRVTQTEIDAAQYLAALGRPLRVYTGGFDLPVSENLTFVRADRGVIRSDQVQRADAVIVSQQLDHAVMLGGRSPLSTADLLSFLKRDYAEVFTSGETHVFLKRTLAGLDKHNAN